MALTKKLGNTRRSLRMRLVHTRDAYSTLACYKTWHQVCTNTQRLSLGRWHLRYLCAASQERIFLRTQAALYLDGAMPQA